jgi:hypothetical protein
MNEKISIAEHISFSDWIATMCRREGNEISKDIITHLFVVKGGREYVIGLNHDMWSESE